MHVSLRIFGGVGFLGGSFSLLRHLLHGQLVFFFFSLPFSFENEFVRGFLRLTGVPDSCPLDLHVVEEHGDRRVDDEHQRNDDAADRDDAHADDSRQFVQQRAGHSAEDADVHSFGLISFADQVSAELCAESVVQRRVEHADADEQRQQTDERTHRQVAGLVQEDQNAVKDEEIRQDVGDPAEDAEHDGLRYVTQGTDQIRVKTEHHQHA